MSLKNLNFALVLLIIGFSACSKTDDVTTTTDDDDVITVEDDYTGTASLTQGFATTTTSNLYADGIRVAGLGTISDTDDVEWSVPADVNYTNSDFPFAPDLYNPDGTQFTTASDALSSFDDSNIVSIDDDGEVITAYIFADNYFEMYVNGVAIGKDAIPFTDFNSHIMKFRVSSPYTIAMLLVDWEENLGLGSEENQGVSYHPGDGGMVAVFKDASGNTVATTGSEWKAQTFYTSPISDLTCPSESGTTRSTSSCSTDGVADGSDFYGLHWAIPSDWNDESYDDSTWPSATTFTNTTIGVSNKPSYTNFTDIFDDSNDDADFIWSTNVILDNEVIVRYTVE